MRVIHKGCAATTYGKSSLSVTDRDGKEIFHTDSRDEALCVTENGLKEIIESVIQMRKEHGKPESP